MALNLAKELDPYFVSPPEWKNEGNGYSLVREGIGTLGQKVHQSFNHEFQAINVEEVFKGPTGVKRYTRATPDRKDPDLIYRNSNIEFTLPRLGAVVGVHSPEGSKDIIVATQPYEGPIENAPSYISGATSPVEFRYNPKRLVKVTLQGEFVSFSDSTSSNLPLREGLLTLVSLASVETPDRMELHKKNAQEELERRFKKSFEPDGEEVKAVDLKTNQVLGRLINDLPAGEAAKSFRILDALGIREKLKISFLSYVLYHPNKLAAFDRMPEEELERMLADVMNLGITTLGIYSRRTSKRWLEADRIKPGSFRFRDFEEEITTEVVEGKDYDTGETRKEFRGVAHKSRKALGRAPYGQRIALLDYDFVIGRESQTLNAQAFTRGREKWRIDKILYKLPATNIKTLLENPTTDPRWITLYVPIQPHFK